MVSEGKTTPAVLAMAPGRVLVRAGRWNARGGAGDMGAGTHVHTTWELRWIEFEF